VAVDHVYVLGAGASYVHGAPLTDQLLPYALSVSPDRNDPRLRLVRDFLDRVFHFKAPKASVKRVISPEWAGIPGLVDVLSVVDVALDRKENLARNYDVAQLRNVRSALEFAIFTALENSLRWRGPGQRGRRSQAMHKLANRLDPDRVAVISFNYDVIADIALAMSGLKFKFDRADVETLNLGNYQAIDYGVEFSNIPSPPVGQKRFRLLKLHGSFNWLFSRLTGSLYFGGMNKAVGILFRNDIEREAANLGRYFRTKILSGLSNEMIGDLEPVMITPTHLKDMRNPHLAHIWRKAEECLRGARRITFIGYSLPSDDLHVKYLFKRAMETRPKNVRPPEIVVIDKSNKRSNPVRVNYERFFGKEFVSYHREGFDEWVRKKPAPLAGHR
jgi:hypothetical protein